MQALAEKVLVFFCFVFVVMMAAAYLGAFWRERRPGLVLGDSFKTLESAVLGLLALLLGFSFSMGVSRYDARHQLEVEEANDIGTTWLRADLLSDSGRNKERELLRRYVAVRQAFFTAGNDSAELQQSLRQTGELQQQMWAEAMAEQGLRRDSVTGQFVASLNDSIDVTEKRTAAYENRIPGAAWMLLIFIGAVSCGLVGANAGRRGILIALPLVIAAAMMLIADLDSPRSGFVTVRQTSMERVAGQVGVR